MANEELGRASLFLDADVDDFNKGMGSAINQIFSFRGAVIAAAAALGFLSAKATFASVKAMASFETAMAGVQKVTGATDEAIQSVGDQLREISIHLGVSSDVLGEYAEAAARAGVATQEVAKFAEVVAKADIATALEGDEIADQLARLVKFLGLSNEEVETVVSTVNELGNRFPTDAERILNATSRMAADFRALGFSAGEILGLAAATSTLRESETNAARRARRLAQELMTPQTIRDLAAAFGITAEKMQSLVDEAPLPTMLALSQIMNSNTAAAGRLADLFDTRVSQSLRNFGLNMGDVQGAIEIANEELGKTQSLNEEVAIFLDTLNKRWDIFKNVIHDIAIEIGQFLKSAILGILGTLTTLAKGFRDMNRATEGAFGALILITGAMFGFAIAIRAIQTIFGVQKGFIGNLIRAGRFIVSLFSPLGKLQKLFLVLATAAATVGTIMKTDFLGLREPINNFFDILTTRLLEPINRHFPALRKEATEVFDAFIGGVQKVVKVTKPLWGPLLAFMAMVAENVFDIIIGVIRTGIDFWLTFLRSFLHFLQGEWKQGLQVWVDFFERTFDGIVNFLSETWHQDIVGTFNAVIDFIQQVFKDFANWLIGNSFIQDTFNAVTNWLKNTWKGSVLGALGNIVSGIVSKVKEGLDWIAKLNQKKNQTNIPGTSRAASKALRGDRAAMAAAFDDAQTAPSPPSSPTTTTGGGITDNSVNIDATVSANSAQEGRAAARGLVEELRSNNMRHHID